MNRLWLVLMMAGLCVGAAPPRANQPYAEATLCARADVILCEDFNYPQNFTNSGDPGPESWINPGLAQGTIGTAYGASARRIALASGFTTKPQGAMPSGSQADSVWSATGGPGSTWGYLRTSGQGTYPAGIAKAKSFYVRFQLFHTANWVWPGDPKTDKYNWGASPCYDNKILYIYPPEGVDNPTSSAYDAGLLSSCGTWDPATNSRFSDALVFRVGDAGDNYKTFPLCSQCTTTNKHNEYGPMVTSPLRNPGQVPASGKIFRMDAGKWYTVEFHYILSSAGSANGTIEAWIDGTKIYSASDLPTCGGGLGDCTGLGAIYLGAYHNGADVTKWAGSQVIDNLVIATSYIGPPGAVTPPPTGTTPAAPGAPTIQ